MFPFEMLRLGKEHPGIPAQNGTLPVSTPENSVHILNGLSYIGRIQNRNIRKWLHQV